MTLATDLLDHENGITQEIAAAALRAAHPGLELQLPAHPGAVWAARLPNEDGLGFRVGTAPTLQAALEQIT